MTSQGRIPCMLIRGGTSKGAFFSAADLPSLGPDLERVLLAAMGSPDPRQIDGLGGGHPLTSKVAIVSPSGVPGCDIDYLFVQVAIDEPLVNTRQTCGNILAGVAAYALERRLVDISREETEIRVFLVNTGARATLRMRTPDRKPMYRGQTHIDGVAGTHAPIAVEFEDVAGSSCGAVLPTGNAVDLIDGVACTLIDYGMPVVVVDAAAIGCTGLESPKDLESNAALADRIETIRRLAGPRMNLGDVGGKTIPKVTLASAPRHGGVVHTRTFIPHRVHESIGVLGAVSVAAAAAMPGSAITHLIHPPAGKLFCIEHPSGAIEVTVDRDPIDGKILRAALIRTARPIFDGHLFVSEDIAMLLPPHEGPDSPRSQSIGPST